DDTRVQQTLEQVHQIAENLHTGTNREQAEAALSEIFSMPESAQLALIKALIKERNTDAADVLEAIHELSPKKEVRKEARRSLIRLEEARVYPRWSLPKQAPLITLQPNAPRFWKGLVTQARQEGEVHLILCWEHGFDYNEVRMLIFLMDFWEQGLKEFIIENTNKRNVDAQIAHIAKQLPDITLTDITLAEARRLIEEALTVNKWRGTTPHKEYRHHLPTVRQLIFDATDPGQDRGYTFIDPKLDPDEVVTTFVAAWTLGDYGLVYDLLTSDSSLRDGLSRDEWLEHHHKWANEARPARVELNFVHEREPAQSALWVPYAS